MMSPAVLREPGAGLGWPRPGAALNQHRPGGRTPTNAESGRVMSHVTHDKIAVSGADVPVRVTFVPLTEISRVGAEHSPRPWCIPPGRWRSAVLIGLRMLAGPFLHQGGD